MPDVYRRDTDLAHLHPVFREKVETMLSQFEAEGLPFRPFECFRSPHRQDWLYQQGRTRPGSVVTKAHAWESYHQYGLAIDFVLFENGKWSWDTAGEKMAWWRRMQELGRAQGLEPVSFEMPHLQLAGVTLAQLREGEVPPDGDETWSDCLESAAAAWAAQPASPPFQLPTSRPPIIEA